jgi:hypothetical protein
MTLLPNIPYKSLNDRIKLPRYLANPCTGYREFFPSQSTNTSSNEPLRPNAKTNYRPNAAYCLEHQRPTRSLRLMRGRVRVYRYAWCFVLSNSPVSAQDTGWLGASLQVGYLPTRSQTRKFGTLDIAPQCPIKFRRQRLQTERRPDVLGFVSQVADAFAARWRICIEGSAT